MIAVRRALLSALSCAVLSAAVTSAGAAQDSTRVRPDTGTARQDTSSLPPLPRVIPTPAPEVPAGPLVPGSRYVFTRDSLAWATAITLSDLLGSIPGVYVARGGFLGQSEYVVYGGRGAAALEIFWDGMPLAPMGGDSVYADAARVYVATLSRVDVEVLPALLRVYLVSERHASLDDRSLVQVGSGDYGAAQYNGLFQKRWVSGVGLGLMANFVGSKGFSGSNRQDHAFELDARLDWMPTDRAGVVYQLRRQKQERSPIAIASSGVTVPGRDGTRTDAMLRFFASTLPAGRGFGGELLFGSSGWGQDTSIGDQGVHHVGLTGRYAGPRAAAEVTARLGDVRVTRSLAGRASIFLPPGLVVSGDAAAEALSGGRSSRRAHGAIALYRGPFSVAGELSWGDAPQAPAVRQDTSVRTVDRAIRVGFETAFLAGHAGFVRRDAYRPLPFPNLPSVGSLRATDPTDNFVADARLRLLPPLMIDGWYSNPVKGAAAFQPPTHGRAQITFRSKFWKKFRSGAFDLKLQVAMESWSRGTAGVSGPQILLNGASFYETFISFQIVGFIAYWDLRNAYNSFETYVPNVPYPRNVQTFGVRWEFAN